MRGRGVSTNHESGWRGALLALASLTGFAAYFYFFGFRHPLEWLF